jgi:two-component system response regulator PrrA
MSGPAAQSVLVVDDDEGVALTFSRMLRLHGYRVETATNPEAGLAIAITRPPDAIILDLRMPLVGGLEFLRRLRAGKTNYATTSVTIVTGDYFIDDEIADEIKSLGAQVSFKPLWLDDLADVVRAMLPSPPPPVSACA